MAGTFVVRRSKDNQYYFYYRGGNNEIMVTSETYTRKQSAFDSIESIKRDAASATVLDMTDKDPM